MGEGERKRDRREETEWNTNGIMQDEARRFGWAGRRAGDLSHSTAPEQHVAQRGVLYGPRAREGGR